MGHQGEHHRDVPGEHKSRAPRTATAYVITCSDTRTEATDEGGKIIRERLGAAGHAVAGSAIVPDDPERIFLALEEAREAGAQFALITGGTGLSRRDVTFDVLVRAVVRPMPGFGELFRSLSYAEIGSAAMLSRALAGQLANGLFVFAMPGSPAAVRLACDKLIIPELGHLAEELGR